MDLVERCGRTGLFGTDSGRGMAFGVWGTEHQGCDRCAECAAHQEMRRRIANLEYKTRRELGASCIILPSDAAAELAEAAARIRAEYPAWSGVAAMEM